MSSERQHRDVETLVLGAGVAGLSYAHARGPSADLVVLDAAERAGGLVHTTHAEVDGQPLHTEWGPEALQSDAPETSALLAELHLEAVPAAPAAATRFVLHHGRLMALPLGPGAFLKSPLLSPVGKLRALTEPWRRPEVGLDASVAAFVRHRLGEQVLGRLVDPFVTGIYAGDPERLSARAAFPTLCSMVEQHGSLFAGLKARARSARAEGRPRRGAPTLLTVRGGLGRLPEALATSLGERLQLRCRAESIERSGSAWQVHARRLAGEHEAGETESFRAQRLIVALPAAAAGRALADAAPAIAEALSSVSSENVVAVSHAWRRQDVGHPLDAFGYLVPSGEDRGHLGTLFSSSIHPERCPEGWVLLRTLMGGARQPRMVDWPDEEILDEVQQGVGRILALRREPRWTQIVRHRAVLPRYDLHHPERCTRIESLLAEAPGLWIVGNHRRGISVNALITTSRELAREHGTT